LEEMRTVTKSVRISGTGESLGSVSWESRWVESKRGKIEVL